MQGLCPARTQIQDYTVPEVAVFLQLGAAGWVGVPNRLDIVEVPQPHYAILKSPAGSLSHIFPFLL